MRRFRILIELDDVDFDGTPSPKDMEDILEDGLTNLDKVLEVKEEETK